jgi:CRISPR/Cas system-associated endonuclease Cas3-HD
LFITIIKDDEEEENEENEEEENEENEEEENEENEEEENEENDISVMSNMSTDHNNTKDKKQLTKTFKELLDNMLKGNNYVFNLVYNHGDTLNHLTINSSEEQNASQCGKLEFLGL